MLPELVATKAGAQIAPGMLGKKSSHSDPCRNSGEEKQPLRALPECRVEKIAAHLASWLYFHPGFPELEHL